MYNLPDNWPSLNWEVPGLAHSAKKKRKTNMNIWIDGNCL